MRDAGLPELDRAHVDTGPRRQITLGQTCPSTMAKEQAAKWLSLHRRYPRPARACYELSQPGPNLLVIQQRHQALGRPAPLVREWSLQTARAGRPESPTPQARERPVGE